MRFSLGNTASTVAATATTVKNFIKNNLKVYFDFKSSRAKTLEFVGAGSAYFDGTDDYIEIAADSNLNLTAEYTYCIWVKVTEDADQMIYTRTDGTDGVWFWVRASGTNMYVEVDKKTSGTSQACTTAQNTIVINTWHHIAWTWNGSNVKIYIDGNSMSLASDNINSNAGSVSANSVFGTWTTGAYDYEGYMKNFGAWKRALSASEIQNIMYKTYNDLKGTETQHLVCWFPLEETKDGDTTKVVDSKGTVGDGTLNNNVSIAAFGASDVYGEDTPRKPRGFDNAPTAQADLIGSGSASFTVGDTDYIDAGTDSNLVLGNNNFSMCGWVKANSLSSHSYMLAVGNDATGKQAGIGFTNANKLFLSTYSSPIVYSAASSTLITTNKWIHLAASYDGSTDYVWFYLDGVLYEKISITTDVEVGKIIIGAHTGTGGGHWDGNLAQVGIWDRTLSQEEIQSIKEKSYSELTTSEKTNLVSWWGLDDGGVDTLDNDVTTVLDLNAVYASELMPLFSTDNYRNATSGMVISMDGSEINFARVTTDAYITTNEIVLEASTPYLFEIETGAANNASSSLLNVRMGLFVSGVSSTTYVSTYMAQNTIYRKHFTSAGSNQNAGLGIRINSNNWNINIKSISLKKITSGNMGTLN
jgi:hypothetical protein